MTKIKICGLYRPQDIAYINDAKPDYAGFIVNFPRSHRSVDIDTLRELAAEVTPPIRKVGVFVDEPVETVIDLLREGTIDLAQLHGDEDDDYIWQVQEATRKEVIKAFRVRTADDVHRAEGSQADHLLYDYGRGEGKAFDWSVLSDAQRPFFLAGGLTPANVTEAIEEIQPFAVDISSGVETDKVKDERKIRQVVAAVRAYG